MTDKEIKQTVYLKALEELLETAQCYFLSALADIGKHIEGNFTPNIKLTLDISNCNTNLLPHISGCCWVSVKSVLDENELSISAAKKIKIENRKHLEDLEKRLKEKNNVK